MRKENWGKKAKTNKKERELQKTGEQKFLRLIPKPHQYGDNMIWNRQENTRRHVEFEGAHICKYRDWKKG